MKDAPWGTSSGDFAWAVGIENTFVPQSRPGHRRLDEYELVCHYAGWREDIDRIATLGVTMLRYGIPWYRVQTAPGVFDWSWTDEVLEYIVVQKGLTPIVDLMHFGTPLWLVDEFANPSYPARVAEYASAFAERYRAIIRHYTPLNEPGVTAAFCGRDGRWPPYLKGDAGFVKILLALARGIAETAEVLRAARADTILVHVEDVGLEFAASIDLAGQAAEAQGRRLLPLDLSCGRVGPSHPLYGWLLEHDASEADLQELATRAPRWDVLGVNFYPWSNRRHARRADGTATIGRDRARTGPTLAPLLGMIHARYRLPLMVTETSSAGGHIERARWMAETLAAVRRTRAEAIPVLGYTWFPAFSMIDWKYRWSRKDPLEHLLHLGLWDIAPRRGRLDRDPTPLIEIFRRSIADPAGSIGEVLPGPVTRPG